MTDTWKLVDIMTIAKKLSWFKDNPDGGYPLMEGSEVEKCILMALDDDELKRYREASECPAVCAVNAQQRNKT